MLAGQHLFGVSLLQLAPSDEAAQNVFAQSVVPSPTTPAFAGIGHEVVVSTIVAPRPGEAVGKDAARQIFAKGLADIGLGCMAVALAVELACTGQLKPGLEVLGDGLVQQRTFGVARVVEQDTLNLWRLIHHIGGL